MGTSSYDAPGVARAIEELGLVGKVFTSGTGMPAANKALLETGSVKSSPCGIPRWPARP